MWYVQGIQPNVLAHTMCRHVLYTILTENVPRGTKTDQIWYVHVPWSVLEVRAHTIE